MRVFIYLTMSCNRRLQLRHRRGKDGTFFFVAARLVFVCACFQPYEVLQRVRGLLALIEARIITACADGLLITCHRAVGRPVNLPLTFLSACVFAIADSSLTKAHMDEEGDESPPAPPHLFETDAKMRSSNTNLYFMTQTGSFSIVFH